ncbi:MAG TPA: tetratricopeptide repeat protein [Isosphaeraceae bacterium]
MLCHPARARPARRAGAHRPVPTPPTLGRPAGLALILVLLLNPAGTVSASRPHGAPGLMEPSPDPLLVSYYETFLRDQDPDAFCARVQARYTEGTLGRLARSGDAAARRAAVFALGLFGGIASNAAVAGALRDADPVVRDLATSALWAIWFRADSPENNATLKQVAALIARRRLDDAEALATRLIDRAPAFAEAYNQRAIARYLQGRFADSEADCRRALERNPYHIGALSGLGGCYLRLDRRPEALATYRRALKLQPHNDDLRQTVATLEAEVE